MSFLSSFKKLLGIGGEVKKRGIENRNVITDKDPNVVWEIVGELGDGAFGKVYKVNSLQLGCVHDQKIEFGT